MTASVALGLVACGSFTSTSRAPGVTSPPAPAVQAAGAPGAAGASAQGVADAGAIESVNLKPTGTWPVGEELRTRSARFRVVAPSDLPGWRQDDMAGALDALKQSCQALRRRPSWAPICSAGGRLPGQDAALRGFFESQFVFLRVLGPDANGEGMVTGYAEPLLDGSPVRQGAFTVPVHGVPGDMLMFDTSRLPAGQRQGTVWLAPQGRDLRLAAAGQPGALSLDLRQVTLDDRDRYLRLRQVGNQLQPYLSRAQIQAQGDALNAPVVAWVRDPIGLYAMQVQGSGRLRMPDGRILRLAYADQNGHPFRPLRVSAAPGRVTRGLGDGAEPPVEFTLDDEEADTEPLDDDDDGAGTTRGLRVQATPAPGGVAPRPVAPRAAAAAAPKPRVTAAAPASPRAGAPASTPGAAAPSALRRTQSDPSYVFFRVAPNQSADAGPVGALGVPLTAGRSIAVDPRVLPLGYPVYMAAQAGKGAGQALRKLVFAQDTGGAIRGAVRADHFWGFGAEAMRAAYATRHRGGLWLMLPSTEYQQLRSARVAKRSLGASPVAELDRACLVPDEAHCFEPEPSAAPQ